jgi:predicted amidophosphoribosyltransferase
MNCPKCLRELHVASEICPHCGIVFAKYFKYHPEQPEQKGDQPPIVTSV